MLIYECSVCGGRYNSNSEWFHHLIQEEHQKLARREMLSWSEGVRARVIVVFGEHPVGWNSKIVEKLSKDGETVVLDFIWWKEERPRVGFVLFQNRETVSKIWRCLEGERFQINDQVCQVMDGGTIPDPEWRTLFPSHPSDDWTGVTPSKRIKLEPAESVEVDGRLEEGTETPSRIPAGESSSKQLKRISISDIDNNANTTSLSNANKPDQIVPVPPKRVKLEPTDQAEPDAAATGIPSSSSSSCKEVGLRHYLRAIRKLIEIPDEEYSMALDITRAFQQTLARDENRGGPRIRAFLSRHWILKLQYCPNKDFKNVGCGITISCIKDPTSKSRWLNLKKLKNHIKQIFNETGSSKHFPQYIVEGIGTDQSLGMGSKVHRYRFTSRNDPSCQLHMNMVLFPSGYCLEIQVWKLAKYLCTFDPRCHPVLWLLFYWAQTNSITVGQSYYKGFQRDMGDPCGLTWLLIFFFQREGLIPSAKEIQQRPHERISRMGSDIGFAEDPGFSTFWKATRTPRVDLLKERDEKFAGAVFKLLYKFFRFCDSQLGGATTGNGLLLNTRDVEIVSLKDMIAGTRISSSSLEIGELNEIKAGFGTDLLEPILMLNPFMLKCRISMVNAKQAFVAMRKTGMQMKGYFDFDSSNPSTMPLVKKEKLKSDEFLNVLKIQSCGYCLC